MIIMGSSDRAAIELARLSTRRVCVVVETIEEVLAVAALAGHCAVVLDVRLGGSAARAVEVVPELARAGAPVLLYSPIPGAGERREAAAYGAAGVLAAMDLPHLGAIVAALVATGAVSARRAGRRRAG